MKINHSTTVKTNRRSESGYTLVEVVMGSVVVLIMGMGLFGGMTSGNSFTQLARQDLRAPQIMLEKMEEIRLYSFTPPGGKVWRAPQILLEKREETRLSPWSQLNGSNGYVIPASFTNYYY